MEISDTYKRFIDHAVSLEAYTRIDQLQNEIADIKSRVATARNRKLYNQRLNERIVKGLGLTPKEKAFMLPLLNGNPIKFSKLIEETSVSNVDALRKLKQRVLRRLNSSHTTYTITDCMDIRLKNHYRIKKITQ